MGLAVLGVAMKHRPFDSIYRPDFEVVEKREGAVSYFPHTDQLPILHRALNLEFRGGLPSGIGKVNAKSDGFRKLLLAQSVSFFCDFANVARQDGVVLFQLLDGDLMARVAVVQQVTEMTRLGNCHRFRFYGGGDFQPEVYLSGKEIIFAEHVLQRFDQRVPHSLGQNLSLLLNCLLQGQILALPVNGGRAFIAGFGDSFLAFPFKESDSEYFITTCLSAKEVHALDPELPPQAFNFHYGRAFTSPVVRTWLPLNVLLNVYNSWEAKKPVEPILKPISEKNWYRLASFMKDVAIKQGHGPGSQLRFVDDVFGPSFMEFRPRQVPVAWNDQLDYAKADPKYDWENIIKQRDELARQSVPVFEKVQRIRPQPRV